MLQYTRAHLCCTPHTPAPRFVQNNDLETVSGLEEISNLDTLNISNNRISMLSNLACCTMLRTLICTNNKLDTVESIAHLAELTGLQTLDLQNNDITDPGKGTLCCRSK